MAILAFSENGKYILKPTLEAARTALSCAGKTIVVTSALTQAQSNITAAWPSDRALKINYGGSVANSTDFKINGKFEASGYVFKGAGQVSFGRDSIPYIMFEWFGSDGNTNSSFDNSPVMTKALLASYYSGNSDDRLDIVVNPGRYYFLTSMNMADYRDFTVRGSSASGEPNSVVFLGLTGATPVVDMSGAHGSSLRNIFILSNYAETGHSTIGVLTGYTTDSDAIEQNFENVQIWLPNEPTANSGLGTVAMISKSAEEVTVTRCQFKANLPLLLTTQTDTSWLLGSSFTISSAFRTLAANSNLVWNFVGNNHFVALNYHRPAIAIQQAADLDLSNVYLGSQTVTTDYAGAGMTGAYKASIAVGPLGSEGINYHGSQERFDIVLDLQGSLARSKMSANVGSVGAYVQGILWSEFASLHACEFNFDFTNVSAVPANRLIFYYVDLTSRINPLSGSITATNIKVCGNADNNTGAINPKIQKICGGLNVQTDTYNYTYGNMTTRDCYWSQLVASSPVNVGGGLNVTWSTDELTNYKGTALVVELDGMISVSQQAGTGLPHGGNINAAEKFTASFGVTRDASGSITVGTPVVFAGGSVSIDDAVIATELTDIEVVTDSSGFQANIRATITGTGAIQNPQLLFECRALVKIMGSCGSAYGYQVKSSN